MAKELSRTFDTTLGAVIVQVQDAMGNVSPHTIYVSGPAGVTDVNAAIAAVLAASDAAVDTIQQRFAAAGWVPSGN